MHQSAVRPRLRCALAFIILLTCIHAGRSSDGTARADAASVSQREGVSGPTREIPVRVRLGDDLTPAALGSLRGAGVRMEHYLGEGWYLGTAASASALEAFRSTTEYEALPLEADQKLHRNIADRSWPTWAILDDTSEDRLVAVVVVLRSDVDLATAGVQAVAEVGGSVIDYVMTVNSMLVHLRESAVNALADDPRVWWIEPPLPPIETLNDQVRAATGVETVQQDPSFGGLDGEGIRVLVVDGGLVVADHPDFGGRVELYDEGQSIIHATHVAATIAGSGLASGGLRRGMAPAATVLSYVIENVAGASENILYSNPGDLEDDYNDAFGVQGAVIANNSIGTNVCANGSDCTWTGDYAVTSMLIDRLVEQSDGQTRIVWAGGNERSCDRCVLAGVTDPRGYASIAPPATVKNPIVAGAVNSDTLEVAAFSGWGPTDDGRLKPDLVAPGCQVSDDYGVTSASVLGSYIAACGTSMAAPTITGITALIMQEHRRLFPGSPDPGNALLKAILIQTADDLDMPGPDYRTGYGLVRADRAIEHLRSGRYVDVVVDREGVWTGFVDVPRGATQLQATIAWDDPAALPSAETALVNDLDLLVFDPVGQRHATWSLLPYSPARPAVKSGRDSVNNVEQVVVDRPAPGRWRISIAPRRLVGESQRFALCFSAPMPTDCNGNGVPDVDEIAAMPSLDCTGNGILDECESDCDGDGIADSCVLASGQATDCDLDGVPDDCRPMDCNGNQLPDACEVADGVARDCNGNYVPDECDTDCDGNGNPDACDIASGALTDCDADLTPDVCQALIDCNSNGVFDACDIAAGTSEDANGNGVPDLCDRGPQTLLVTAGGCAGGADGTEGNPFCTIQDAVNASLDGDTIVLAPGIYVGEKNRNIDFHGRLITVRSTDPDDPDVVAATVIDCDYRGRGFYFHFGETSAARVEGLTIRRGLSSPGSTPDAYRGGGILATDSSPTISRCIISECQIAPVFLFSLGGAGIYLERSEAVIEDCDIVGNTTTSFAGGIYCYEDSRPTISGCRILDNVALSGGGLACGVGSAVQIETTYISDNVSFEGGSGGGLNLYGGSQVELTSSVITGNLSEEFGGAAAMNGASELVLRNCTVYGNTAEQGGGVLTTFESSLEVESSLLWANATGGGPEQVRIESDSRVTIEFSDIQEGEAGIVTATGSSAEWGVGAFDLSPVLVDPETGDFTPSSDSPLVNAGASLPGLLGRLDVDGRERVQQCRVDVGAAESASYTDCNGNGRSDACDVAEDGASDCDRNLQPDTCQDTTADCNSNDVWDACDIDAGMETDCNRNVVPDSCELLAGADDCNENGILDTCDINGPDGADVNGNGVLDECESCNGDAACADGIYCNGVERCISGVCTPGNSPCPGRICAESTQSCVDCIIDVHCHDDNDCTEEYCNHGECIRTELEGACNDSQPCTVNDTCVEGHCIGTILPDCGVDVDLEAVAINGQSITPSSTVELYDDETLTVELRMTGWGPESLRLYNISIDGAGYESGLRGALRPITDPDPSAGAFIDQSHPDYVFAGIETIVGVFNTDPALYQFGALVLFGEDCVVDDGSSVYLGTLRLQPDFGTAGRFLICPDTTDSDFDYSPDNTFVIDCEQAYTTPISTRCLDVLVIADCNDNDIPDDIDIAEGTSQDCTGNGIPDECEPDCDGDGLADVCALAAGDDQDCNANGVPDLCDVDNGESVDCNVNHVPDECETDCNANGVPDDCDLANGTSDDCDGFGIPDECEDCNGNGQGDICDLDLGVEPDCNGNMLPDSCDISSGASTDCNIDGIPDDCQVTDTDCNGNGIWDVCDVFERTSFDCNGNGTLDECDLAAGTSTDCDGNLLPDECFDYFQPVIDVAAQGGIRGFAMRGFRDEGRLGSWVSRAGDVNGDGIGDLVVGADSASIGSCESCGEAYIVFGQRLGWTDPVDVFQRVLGFNSGGMAFHGDAPGDFLGSAVSGGGDFNGDGFDDVILGAPGANFDEGVTNVGETCLIFGRATLDLAAPTEPDTLNGENGFRLRGGGQSSSSGRSLSFLGDVNGDGFDDFIIGASTYTRGESSLVGRSYVVFGSDQPQSTVLLLEDLDPGNGGDGSRGFVIDGIDPFDQAGFSVAAAGDVNADGFDDILLGAHPADPYDLLFAGETYLIFGGESVGGDGLIELATLDGVNGVTINGADEVDLSGHHVAPAGDVNGDGVDDFLTAAVWADPNGRPAAGETYLFFGHAGPWPAVIDIIDYLPGGATEDGQVMVTLNGIDANDFSGFVCARAGDVNHDGFDDLLIGAYGADTDLGSLVGEAYVYFGHAPPWNSSVELATVAADAPGSERVGFMLVGEGNMSGMGLSVDGAGDINGDGVDDFLLGAPLLDLPPEEPEGEPRADRGGVYVTFGRMIEPADCNANGMLDRCDLQEGTSTDCNGDLQPDECNADAPDCNDNGFWDFCDLAIGESLDCNGNGIPDKCDIAASRSTDCNGNVVPDECEADEPLDCNGNRQWDACDIHQGVSADCDDNGVPDECEPGGNADCDSNGVIDLCDIYQGAAMDVNANGVPDSCEPSETIHVNVNCNEVTGGSGSPEDPYCHIRDAMRAAGDGLSSVITIRVAAGVYTGTENRNIDFGEGLDEGTRSVLVHGIDGPLQTVIDLGGVGSAFRFERGETKGARVRGFAIMNAQAGAIRVTNGSEPILEELILTQNFRSGGGAGIRCVASSPQIRRCIVAGNFVNGIGCSEGSHPWITDSLIVGNHGGEGGGLYAISGSRPHLQNCTVAGNFANWGYGGILAQGANQGTSNSTIVYDNHPLGSATAMRFSFSAVEGGNLLSGNINESPRFAARHAGTWTAASQSGPAPVTTVLFDENAAFEPGALRGAFVNTAVDSSVQLGVPIIDNTATTITILGDAWLIHEVGGRYEVADYRLASTSPCINAGDIDLIPSLNGPRDLAGSIRVRHCRVDMGATETDIFVDCDGTGLSDACEGRAGQFADCNENLVPDSCEADCNFNGIADPCELLDETATDVNFNLELDECELRLCDLDRSGGVNEADRAIMLDCLLLTIDDPQLCSDIDFNMDDAINVKDLDVFDACYRRFSRVRPKRNLAN